MRTVALGEIVTEARSGFASGEDIEDGIVQVRMNNVTVEGAFDWSKLRRVPKPKKLDELIVEPNDILFNATNSPDLVGKNAVFRKFSEPITFSNHFIRLRVNRRLADSGLISRWLTDQWRRGTFKSMCRQWVNQASLSRDQLLSLSIPLLPLDQQRRIAAILDQADDLRHKQREALARLDKLPDSFMAQMCGNLASNRMGWPVTRLGDVCSSVSDGPHVSPAYVVSGIPFLSTRNIRPNGIVWEDLKFISGADARVQWKKVKPARGDILYTKGGTTGIARAVDFDLDFAVWVHVAVLKLIREKVEPIWLQCILNYPLCYEQSQRLTKGIVNRDLGLRRMIEITFPLPPLDVQRAFATRVAEIDSLRAHHRAHLTKLDALFASLQHRAFRGEL